MGKYYGAFCTKEGWRGTAHSPVLPKHDICHFQRLHQMIFFTELMGSTIHMHVNIAGEDAVVILPTIDLSAEQKNGFKYGTKINITFGGNVVHMFGKDTERNLL